MRTKEQIALNFTVCQHDHTSGAMNKDKGIFTAKESGTYLFSMSGFTTGAFIAMYHEDQMSQGVGVRERTICGSLESSVATRYIILFTHLSKYKSDLRIQWSMTLTDMRLTEYMGLTEKSATTELFIC